MKTYALRVIPHDMSLLIANAEILGVLAVDDNGTPYEKNGGYWDVIGKKRVGAAPDDGTPDTRPFAADENGVPYIHINVRTPVDVGAVAAALAESNPDIAAGLAQLGRFFVVDQNGETKWPDVPMRGFL